jgi:hypothetical protein
MKSFNHIFLGENYVTSSLIIPLITQLQQDLMNLTGSVKSDVAMLLHQSLINSVIKRLLQYEDREVPQISTFLDQRFKKLAFRSETKAANAQKLVEIELKRIMAQPQP